MTYKELVYHWRDQHGYTGRGGVVVVYHGEVCGWMDRLRNPESWQPGCVAIDEDGRTWQTIAGNDYAGALMWLPLDHI